MKNELIEMIEQESAKRTSSNGYTFKVISETIILIGQRMEEGKATPKDVEKLMEVHDALDVVVDQFKSDVSNWASSFSFGEEVKTNLNESAPDMLEALKEVHKWISLSEYEYNKHLVKVCEKAIAKAEVK